MGPFGILHYNVQHKSLMALLHFFFFLFFYYHSVRVPLVCLKKNLNASRPSKLNATRPSEHQSGSNIGSTEYYTVGGKGEAHGYTVPLH